MLSLAGDASGKKAALTLGVRNATGSIIVTTDADCRHAAGWLRAVLSPFQEGADVVAGPVVYDKRGSLFARLQALEFLGLVGVGAGFFGIGYPRLCNGANFAYRKSMFDKVHGYDGNDSVHTGDDEFLLHRIVYREGGRAVFAATEAAIVHTDGAATLSEFFRQRVRWASKTRQYEDRSFVSFLVVLFVYLLFAAAAPVVSSTSAAALIAGAVFFALKVIADTAVLIPSARMFRQPIRMGDILVGEFLHAYYIVVVTCIGMFGKFQWKNRRLKNSTRTSG
jgi:cellulose synthase/poly-beta-1,6-N-acetylglucosamine synthase-like glycosyltransferase